jgi:hypothetical protein
MSVRKVFIGSALALTASTACADIVPNGFNMLPRCRAFVNNVASDSPLVQGFCEGVVFGVGVMLEQPRLPNRCVDIPSDVSYRQLVLVVVRYIEARPNRMHEAFVILARDALIDAWPCRR